jgi:anaerobic selenocysteine-containing dehydrogenase
LSATNKEDEEMKVNGKNITEILAINRRNFIKFAVGGAVGTGLSPLPWKLLDDTAIFTQNFPWVSVPEVGEFSFVKSVCALCPGGCGIEVRKVGERAVKIEGRTDYPVNPGGLCPLGMGGLQLLYNEGNRFTGPMKRIGPRGSGKFIDITWEEAIETLANRLTDLRNKGIADSIVAVDGNPMESTMSTMIERLLKTIGSPNYMRIPSSEDTNQIVTNIMYGKTGPVTYDLENADYILSFGSGFLEGWGSPGRVLNAWGLWKSGPLKDRVKIVQIESRASNTASKADKWIAPVPGTETALALGLAHVMIKEELCNSAFLNEHCFGFSDWKSADGQTRAGFKDYVLKEYSPEKVSVITKVKVEDIVSTAREFAGAKSPLAVCGRGKGMLNGSVLEYMSVHALNALTGNLNRPGGIYIHKPLPLSPLVDMEIDDIAKAGLQKDRLDRAGSDINPINHSLFFNLSDRISKNSQPEVDTMLIFSSNPAFTLPDGGDFRHIMSKVPFIVSFSPYRDESALMADLVLPDHNYLEKVDDIVWPAGIQYPVYGLTQPVIDPLYDTKNSGDVIIRIANKIGGTVGRSFPWRNYEAVLKERIKGLAEVKGGLTEFDNSMPVWKQMQKTKTIKADYRDLDDLWKRLKSGGLWYQPVFNQKNIEGLFATETGKFEFYSNKIKDIIQASNQKDTGITVTGDEAAMPHFEYSAPEEDTHMYPLKMVPYELINLSSGWLPNPPYLNKTIFDNQLLKDESFAEINPRTAAEYDLKQGDRVQIESEKGKVQARINIFEGAMPGIVYLPMGFGHTAYDDFTRGKGVNPNDIISGGKDPISGHPVWWNTSVRLIKVHI